MARSCCWKSCSKPQICSAEAQTAGSEQTVQDSKTAGPMQLIAAQERMTGQIGSKRPKRQPANCFLLVPVQTVWTKRFPSVRKPLSKPAQVLTPLTALMTDWVDVMGAPPAAVQRIWNWIRPDCCEPVQARSAVSLRIQFPPSEQIVWSVFAYQVPFPLTPGCDHCLFLHVKTIKRLFIKGAYAKGFLNFS